MNSEELKEKSQFKIQSNESYTQYLLPQEHSPLSRQNRFGSWLLVFKTEKLLTTWIEVHEALKMAVLSNRELSQVVNLEGTTPIDTFSLCQERGFNSAYTTESYAEYLESGDCEPNEYILDDLEKLDQALKKPFLFEKLTDERREIIESIIDKSFVQPNGELHWADADLPWNLFIPPINDQDLKNW